MLAYRGWVSWNETTDWQRFGNGVRGHVSMEGSRNMLFIADVPADVCFRVPLSTMLEMLRQHFLIGHHHFAFARSAGLQLHVSVDAVELS